MSLRQYVWIWGFLYNTYNQYMSFKNKDTYDKQKFQLWWLFRTSLHPSDEIYAPYISANLGDLVVSEKVCIASDFGKVWKPGYSAVNVLQCCHVLEDILNAVIGSTVNILKSLMAKQALKIVNHLLQSSLCLLMAPSADTLMVAFEAWIRNYIFCFHWHVITHPCLNFNGSLVELLLKLRHGLVITSIVTYRCN